jgi:hypothetical protein
MARCHGSSSRLVHRLCARLPGVHLRESEPYVHLGGSSFSVVRRALAGAVGVPIQRVRVADFQALEVPIPVIPRSAHRATTTHEAIR